MCGLLGMVGGSAPALDIEAVAAAIGHRGPDATAIERLQIAGVPAVLGHARLSILDLSDAGAQPMRSQDGRWVVVYNGEIYNHTDLRARMPGIAFRSRCDTETLVEALALWGVEATLNAVNGIFAFAALDLKDGLVHLARDPFGVKPLYHTRAPRGGMAFASEMRGLRALAPETNGIDAPALERFLALRYNPAPRTLWPGVSRLPPGTRAVFDPRDGSLRCHRYVTPTRARFAGGRRAAAEAYRDVLGAAVRRQLLSDVPLGVFLSGGIDSALVAALAVENGARPTAYTVGFGAEHEDCEIEPAADTARILGLPHEIVRVDAESAWRAVAPALSHVEEPLGTTSILPMWRLAGLAGGSVKVVLTGQGSDEPWGGYRRHRGVLATDPLPKLGAFRPMWRLLARAGRRLPSRLDFAERALRSMTAADEAERFTEIHAMFDVEERAAMLRLTGTRKRDDGDGIGGPLRDWLTWADPNRSLTPVERMMAVDARMNLADDLLLYGDKITMAHSIEARVPILDREVVRFVESLPRALRLDLRRSKIVHRDMAARYLPARIVERPKKGFDAPVGAWLRGPWAERAAATLLEGRLGDVLDRTAVERVWRGHVTGRRDRTRQVFALLGLAGWLDANL